MPPRKRTTTPAAPSIGPAEPTPDEGQDAVSDALETAPETESARSDLSPVEQPCAECHPAGWP